MSFRFSCPHTSPQNGKAERKIRTINNIIRTLLAHASIPPSFWHHALQMATYLHSILPNKKLALQTPTKILYRKDPSYSHLKVFGCLCYPLIPSTSRNKLQARTTPCVFLGYPSNHRGYKCYELSSRKIFISRHATFDENTFPFSNLKTPTRFSYNFLDDDTAPFLPSHIQPTPTHNELPLTNEIEIQTPPNNIQQTAHALPTAPPTHTSTQVNPSTLSTPPIPSPPLNQSNNSHISPPTQPASTTIQHFSPQMTTRAQHGIFKPRQLFNLYTSAHTTISPLPTNPIDALKDHNWKMAMKDEYDSLYVDDIILTASSNALRDSIMSKLGSEFAMKDLGPLSYFLGISVTRHSGGHFSLSKEICIGNY
jgi:histone deacetylase 1/2